MATSEPSMNPRPCSTCGVSVYDLTHSRTGKLAPIDAEPSADGNVLISLDHGTYVIIPEKDRAEITLPKHKNHWATCRDAAQWRKRYAQRFDGKP